jgi:hypothetical protein
MDHWIRPNYGSSEIFISPLSQVRKSMFPTRWNMLGKMMKHDETCSGNIFRMPWIWMKQKILVVHLLLCERHERHGTPGMPNGNHDRSQTTFEVWFSGLAASECHPTFLLCAMDHCKPQRCQEKVHLWTNHLDIYTFVNGFKVVVHSLSCTKQRWQHPVPKYPGVRRMKGNLQQTAVAHGFLSGFLVKQRT